MASHCVVIGGGFGGLAAAWELVRQGWRVTLLEAEDQLGGLAGAFPVGEAKLERFYHHWFNSDAYLSEIIHELGKDAQVMRRETATGMYFAGRRYRLSSPLDVLRFTPLSLLGRVRLGLMVLRARQVKDWRSLDGISAADWLRRLAGAEVFKTVWEPLLIGKFGRYAEKVSAAWFWGKLILRGGSRNRRGKEELCTYQGGFAALVEDIAAAIRDKGGEIRLSTPCTGIETSGQKVTGVLAGGTLIPCDAVISTLPLPLSADVLGDKVPAAYAARLRKVEYLANTCLVLLLERSLSGLYWTNVNDTGFPFVGVIEHTNFETPAAYAGKHVVYLSRYLPADDPVYAMDKDELLRFALPHIQRMFPDFSPSWIHEAHVWKARYAQPLVTVGYAELIPPNETPLENLYLASMAQIFPEDRGTNYALREGRRVAKLCIAKG